MKLSELSISRKQDLVDFYEENKEQFETLKITLEGDKREHYEAIVREFLTIKETEPSDEPDEEIKQDSTGSDDEGAPEPEAENEPEDTDEVPESQPVNNTIKTAADVGTINSADDIDEVEKQAKQAKEVEKNSLAAKQEEEIKQHKNEMAAKKKEEEEKETIEAAEKKAAADKQKEKDTIAAEETDKEYHDMDIGELLLSMEAKGFETKRELLESITINERAIKKLEAKQEDMDVREKVLIEKEAKMVNREASFEEVIESINEKNALMKIEYTKLDEKKKQIEKMLKSF